MKEIIPADSFRCLGSKEMLIHPNMQKSQTKISFLKKVAIVKIKWDIQTTRKQLSNKLVTEKIICYHNFQRVI